MEPEDEESLVLMQQRDWIEDEQGERWVGNYRKRSGVDGKGRKCKRSHVVRTLLERL